MGSRLIKSLFIVVLVLYFLFLLVARIPATWGAWAVQEAVPGVWLTGVNGTIWDGRAKGGTVAVGTENIPVKDLRWEVQPWRLLTLSACADVNAQVVGQPASGTFCRTPGDVVAAENVQLSTPMSIVSQWLGVDLAGPASLQIQELRVQGGERVEHLKGNISWRDARWQDGDRWVPLGAFAADLAANEQGGIRAEVFDLDGPFTLELTGNFVLHQEPVIAGTVAPTAEAPAQIRQLLELLGEPVGDGRFRLAWPPGT